MKYTLILALFAVVAIASTHAYPTGEEETPKEPEVKVEEKPEAPTNDPNVKNQESVDVAASLDAAAASESASPVSDEDKCEPGSSFAKECNTCVCPPSGARSLSACTLKLCLPEKTETTAEEATNTETAAEEAAKTE